MWNTRRLNRWNIWITGTETSIVFIRQQESWNYSIGIRTLSSAPQSVLTRTSFSLPQPPGELANSSRSRQIPGLRLRGKQSEQRPCTSPIATEACLLHSNDLTPLVLTAGSWWTVTFTLRKAHWKVKVLLSPIYSVPNLSTVPCLYTAFWPH